MFVMTTMSNTAEEVHCGLLRAIRHGNLTAFRNILATQAGQTDIQMHGGSLLFFAVNSNRVEILDILLDSSINPAALIDNAHRYNKDSQFINSKLDYTKWNTCNTKLLYWQNTPCHIHTTACESMHEIIWKLMAWRHYISLISWFKNFQLSYILSYTHNLWPTLWPA